MNQKNTIREMLSEERPYEKCERFGAGSLTDIELLAVLLRTGTKGESALDLARKLFYPGEGTTATSQSPSSKLDKRRTAENQWNRKSKGYSDLMPL